MKRVLSLILALLTLFSLCACSSSLATEEKAQTKTEEAKTEAKTEEEKETEEPLPTGEIVYPEGFSVGYNRQSIAPEVFPIPTYTQFDHVGYSNHDEVQLTCTAFCDGKTAFLLISLDMRGMDTGILDYSYGLIEKAVGIPKEQVMINCTHTHSAPDNVKFGQGEAMKAWQQLYYKRLIRAVTLAMHDLTPTDAYIGTSHTDGVTFSRRYLMDDGTYMTNPGGDKKGIPVAYETQADTELRTVRFDRGDKKDVVLCNYQTHYHGSFSDSVSADWVHVIREYVEKEMDVHFAYQSGASANINFKSALGDRKYPDLVSASTHIAQVVVEATKTEEKANLGSLQFETSLYDGRTQSGTKKVNFSAFTIGDIGFVAAPYEMFDTNGQEVRAASPCKMTFVCSLTNGGFGYVPAAYAYPHGTYEVEITQFREGSGEEFAQEMVRLLNACKAKE